MYRCTNLPIWPRKRPGKHDLCKFPHRTCSLPALENYEFCIKHILEDKTAPFKTCGYVYSINGKKCNRPAPDPQLVERKEGGFCAEHTRKAQVTRQRAGGRHCPPQTVESLLTSLSHYASNNAMPSLNNEMETDSDSFTKAVNPFVELDASKINVSADRILEYVSESDSDIEPATLEYVWRDNDRDSSDAESVDSQQEDPLKHAGVYTAEEAALIVKEKMFRLQTLYYDQFKRLQHVLKERKRRYYHAFLKEKDAISKNNMTTIHEQSKTSSKELKLYEKLKALNQFHRRCGEEGILHMRVREKRNQAKKMKRFRNKSRISDFLFQGKNEGLSMSPAPTCKCIYTEGGVKCGLKTLPSSKYCRKHILEDSNQKLFRPCGCEKADVLCQEPVLNVFENASCPLHVSLPILPHLNVEIEEKKEEKGAGDVKYKVDNIPETLEETSTVGPGGDVSQAQNITDKENETSAEKSVVETDTNNVEKSTNDSVMDDIMANVDVVEEIVSQNENEQSSQPSEKSVMESDINSVAAVNDNDNSNLSSHTSEEVNNIT